MNDYTPYVAPTADWSRAEQWPIISRTIGTEVEGWGLERRRNPKRRRPYWMTSQLTGEERGLNDGGHIG